MNSLRASVFAGLLLALAGCSTTATAPTPKPAAETRSSQTRPVEEAPRAKDLSATAPGATAAAEVPVERKIYALHHRILPRVLFETEGRAFADLHAGNFDRLRAIISDYLGADYAKGVRFKVVSAPDIVFITFPEPKDVPHCYHVALVRSGESLRFITLEKAEDFMNSGVKTILCGWTANGSHQNFGSRMFTDLATFEREVAAHIEKQP